MSRDLMRARVYRPRPDFLVAGRKFWRLRKHRPSAGMFFWLTEEPSGGHEGSDQAFDIRTLPLWQERFGTRDELSVTFAEYPAVLADAIGRGIDLVAYSAACWAERASAEQRRWSPSDDLDADIPF